MYGHPSKLDLGNHGELPFFWYKSCWRSIAVGPIFHWQDVLSSHLPPPRFLAAHLPQLSPLDPDPELVIFISTKAWSSHQIITKLFKVSTPKQTAPNGTSEKKMDPPLAAATFRWWMNPKQHHSWRKQWKKLPVKIVEDLSPITNVNFPFIYIIYISLLEGQIFVYMSSPKWTTPPGHQVFGQRPLLIFGRLSDRMIFRSGGLVISVISVLGIFFQPKFKAGAHNPLHLATLNKLKQMEKIKQPYELQKHHQRASFWKYCKFKCLEVFCLNIVEKNETRPDTAISLHSIIL